MQVKFMCASVLAAMAMAMGVGARAQPIAPPTSGVLSLSSSATAEVTQDVLSVAFSAAREGNEAQAVQSALKQALDAALGEATSSPSPPRWRCRRATFRSTRATRRR